MCCRNSLVARPAVLRRRRCALIADGLLAARREGPGGSRGTDLVLAGLYCMVWTGMRAHRLSAGSSRLLGDCMHGVCVHCICRVSADCSAREQSIVRSRLRRLGVSTPQQAGTSHP